MANKPGKTVVNEMQTEIRTWGLWLMGIVISQGFLRGSGSIQPIKFRVYVSDMLMIITSLGPNDTP